MGREITISLPPQRIISVVPSQTELLYDLGLDQEVIAITKFCIHPERWRSTKPRIGGTKMLHIATIESMAPDLILANKEENNQEQIETLADRWPVWLSDILTFGDAVDMIHRIGAITHRVDRANELIETIEHHFSILQSSPKKQRTCAYLIWWNPMMTINHQTFIHDMLDRCGLINVFADINHSRYPIISEAALQAANPEVILLSSEPFPFSEKYIALIQKIVPKAKILLVDGELFSWYGSRLIHSPHYFQSLINQL